MSSRKVIPVLLLAFAGGVSADEVEVSALLQNWVARKSFDADFTCWEVGIDGIMTYRGRIYFETSGCCRYEVEPLTPSVREVNWRGSSYHVKSGRFSTITVWHNGETLSIDPDKKEVVRCTDDVRMCQSQMRREVKAMPVGFDRLMHQIGLSWAEALTPPATPQDVLPLVLGADADTVQEKYVISVRRRDEGLFLSASPRLEDKAVRGRKMCVEMDQDSHLPRRLWLLHERPAIGDIVYEFHKVTVDRTPDDRNALFAPDLDGYEIIE